MEIKTRSQDLTPGAIQETELYRQDIADMGSGIQRLRSGSFTEDDFKKFRLQRGIYGQKQKPDIQMIRVKVPWGRLTADQLECLADISDRFPGEDRAGISHITTRQDIQFHFVKLDRIPEAMELLRQAGLTTREACANTVRNVTADPLAGVAADEVFDVSPHAEAVARFFLRHPVCQNMPRKFKIAFSGSPADRGLVLMHDLGCLAEVRTVNGRPARGFKLYAGGGLGPTPKVAQLIEDFTPEDDFLRTIHATLFVFNRDWDYGRVNRNMARVKFLVEKIGIVEFRRRVLAERENLKNEEYPAIETFLQEETPSDSRGPFAPEAPDPEYRRWKSTNVQAQKQPGYSMVTIRLPLGDIRSRPLRALAGIVRKFSNGFLRTTVTQNLVIRWVKNEALFSLWEELSAQGLALPSAERLADITSCPGADTCQLGITSSRGLATAIGALFQNGHRDFADFKDIKIKVSGCPNSCGQHHIADIGFFGGAKSVDGHQVPTYTMLLGGHIGDGETVYGKSFLRVPAKRIPSVVGKLLDLFKAQKKDGENFRSYVKRVGFDFLKKEVEPLAQLPSGAGAEFSSDWGQSGEFQIEVGKGECAA